MKYQLEKLLKEYRDLQPVSAEIQKKLDNKFRLEFNFNSNHIEGNTLTYGETKLLILFDQTKGSHELRELEEMKAHDVALLMIKEEAADKEKPLTEKFIKDLNHTILVRPFWKEAITADGQATRRIIKVGEYKEFPNSVRQENGEIFEYASPQETPILMADLVRWYNEEVEKQELTAIELATLLHYRYIRIHPFDDGNGRVARLLVNYVLYKNDLPPVIIKTDDKKNYLRALQQADTGDLEAFIEYMIQQLIWSIDLSIRAGKGESIEEQDDWEKQLSLLKKGLNDKTKEVLKKSEESVKYVFSNVIMPFAKLYEEKLSQFDSLFMDRNVNLKYGHQLPIKDQNTFKVLEELYNSFISNEKYFHFIEIEHFEIFTNFETYRNPYKSLTLSTPQVRFIFMANAYGIDYSNIGISKAYNDLLTEDEMKLIISNIGKDLLQNIEQKILK